jgi:hypothetical protein
MLLKNPNGPFQVGEHLFLDDPHNLTRPTNHKNLRALVVIRGKGIYDPGQFFKPWFVESSGIKTIHELIDYLARVGAEEALASLWSLDYGYVNYNTDGSVVFGVRYAADKLKVKCRDDFGPGCDTPKDMAKWVKHGVVGPVDFDLDQGYRSVLETRPFYYREDRDTPPFLLLPSKTGTTKTKVHDIFTVSFRYTGSFGYKEVLESTPLSPEDEGKPTVDEWLEGVRFQKVMNYTHSMDSFEWSFFRRMKGEHPDSKMFFGMEVECDSPLSFKELQTIVQKVEPKQEPFFCGKADSSISRNHDNQYELVTVPMTPAKLRYEWSVLIEKITRLAKAKGMTLEQVFPYSTSNGVHIHISKAAFADPVRRKLGEEHRSRFLAALNSAKNIDLIRTFSGRDFVTNHYCGNREDRMCLEYSIPKEKVYRRVGSKSLRMYREKYSPAHDNKPETVEVRVFSGHFDLAHFKRAILFVEAMFYFTKFHSYTQVFDITRSFTKWVATQPQYNTIKKELKACA